MDERHEVTAAEHQGMQSRFRIEELEERIAPCSSASGPPGQCGAGNPGHAPGNSNEPGNSK